MCLELYEYHSESSRIFLKEYTFLCKDFLRNLKMQKNIYLNQNILGTYEKFCKNELEFFFPFIAAENLECNISRFYSVFLVEHHLQCLKLNCEILSFN